MADVLLDYAPINHAQGESIAESLGTIAASIGGTAQRVVEAANSATAAAASASNAATSASNAATSASAANTSKNNAATSATNAANSATAAASSAASAAASAETAEQVLASIPADYTALDGKVTELKNDLTKCVSIDGTDEVTPKNLQILDKVISPNLIDTSKITDGKYITADGVEHNGNYFVTDYIPVEAGEQYCGTVLFTNATTGNTILYPLAIRWLACYDSDKNVIASAGSNTQIVTYPYTIADGVAYVSLSMNNNASYSQHQFERGAESTAYHPYGEVISAEIKRKYIPQEDVDMADIPAFHLVEGQNLINKDDADYVVEKFIARDGQLRDNVAYVTTGYIAVNPGDTLLGSHLNANGVTVPATIAYIATYDSNKTVVVNSGVSGGSSVSYIVPEGIYYVRCSIRVASFTPDIQITRTDSGLPKPYKPYEAPHYEILDSYTPQGEPPLHVYLPSDIYVAVGRTIELYNEQVCIDHEKYHFQWVCAEGSAYARKFSITGTTAKNLNLDLYLYDDKRNVCWCGRCVIHVVAASNPSKKILPIGDSLTNWKAWLQEIMLLSGNHISWLGTRYSGQSVDSEGNVYASGTIHHEGRSGWKASDYLSNAIYDFDDRYDGVGTVAGTANPFWDGTKFSLSHYLAVQTGVSTPDAVQIFLGTNDIRFGIEPATADIVSMVQSIRTEYPSMPIFVCNTIYNANQNGYGSVGTDAYAQSTGANAWQYEQDCLIMDLMKSLKTALASCTGVYIIPLASCMDREYDFGHVMTKVNPRSNVEVAMPVERIHPQASGYYQMADLMYSFYCGVLS
jgi:lysophospholipase L1-like esterase